jgi:hypothetical protein
MRTESEPAEPQAGPRSEPAQQGILLLGGAGWNTIPTASTPGKGVWSVTNLSAGQLPGWAGKPGVQALTANFTGFGMTDIALLGGPDWNTIPLAIAQGNDTWNIVNPAAGGFPGWAAEPGVTVLTGDFGNTRRDSIALTGAQGWDTIPLALSDGNSGWTIMNVGTDPRYGIDFAALAAVPGVKAVAGDFQGLGQADIVLLGDKDWQTIPMAVPPNAPDDLWKTWNPPAGDFPSWAAQPGAQVVTGKFGDIRKTCIALLGGPDWDTIPIAFPEPWGQWTISNSPAPQFPGWAAMQGVKVVTGDFTGNGWTDIALLGPGWDTIPVAFSTESGWVVTNQPAGEFPGWATQPGVQVVTGKFSPLSGTAIALTGNPDWDSIPVAFPVQGGNWAIANNPVIGFPGLAAAANVRAHAYTAKPRRP